MRNCKRWVALVLTMSLGLGMTVYAKPGWGRERYGRERFAVSDNGAEADAGVSNGAQNDAGTDWRVSDEAHNAAKHDGERGRHSGMRTGRPALQQSKEVIPYWTEDSEAMESIIDYVKEATDEGSSSFIPVEDRIVTFDMDGTLMGELYPYYFDWCMLLYRIMEDPDFEADDEMWNFAMDAREAIASGSVPEELDAMKNSTIAPAAYKDMTLEEFMDYVREFKTHEVDGFNGMTYEEAFFKPMVSLVQYLSENDFTVYVVSGCDRFIVRAIIEDVLGEWVQVNHVIGSDNLLVADHQGSEDGETYTFRDDDEILIGGAPIVTNVKMNKVTAIAREIGKVPVLAFGNSTGDLAMAEYTLSNEDYDSAAYLLLCDDTERDYGNPEKAASLMEKCDEAGFETVSMKDEFKTIYGDEVKKTERSFFGLSEDGISEDSARYTGHSPKWVRELPEAADADQLFVVAGVDTSTAYVSMHELDENGRWQEIISTPGFIGMNGLGKTREGDGKTPVGDFYFTEAFGVAPDPGCDIDYKQVDEKDYWSCDPEEGMLYNEMVSIDELPDLDIEVSEHLIDFPREYEYVLNISYNEEGTPGLGSAIFLHCLSDKRPHTGGGIVIPRDMMKKVLETVDSNCVVVIDSMENLGAEF